MKTRALSLMAAVAIVITGLIGRRADAETYLVTNVNANPSIFECSLSAVELPVTIVTTNGSTLVTNTVHAMVHKDDNAANWPPVTNGITNGIPIPVMMLRTGQMVICH